jgi:acyl CoA:acetate/3-ketoacid CoA transferase alpha subunit
MGNIIFKNGLSNIACEFAAASDCTIAEVNLDMLMLDSL